MPKNQFLDITLNVILSVIIPNHNYLSKVLLNSQNCLSQTFKPVFFSMQRTPDILKTVCSKSMWPCMHIFRLSLRTTGAGTFLTLFILNVSFLFFRVIRQIMQSLPPILDMLSLLLFFMLIFSVLGWYRYFFSI